MPESNVLIRFVLATLLLLVTPGPCLALLVSTGVSQGKSAAMYVVGGIALSDALGSLLTALGVVVWLIQVPTALLTLKPFGIAYLLFATTRNGVRSKQPKLEPCSYRLKRRGKGSGEDFGSTFSIPRGCS